MAISAQFSPRGGELKITVYACACQRVINQLPNKQMKCLHYLMHLRVASP